MPDPGFVGAAYTAASITQDAQDCVNWYVEVDQAKNPGTKTLGVPGERGVLSLYPTPGLTLSIQLAYGEVRGLYTVTGGNTLFAVSGSTLYAINSQFVATAVGTLQSVHGQVSMIDNGISVYIVDGNNRYTCGLTGANFSLIASTDGAFQGGDKCGIVDSFIFYNNPNTNQWGCTNALSTVSGNTNFASMIGSPDNIVSLFNTNREVFLMGTKYSEWWINVGSFPFPFQVIPGTSTQHGCVAKYSPARFGEAFAFLACDDRGQSIVVMMNGYVPQRISTFAVEQAIAKYNTVSDAIGMSYQQAGHEFYILTFPSADATWVYDLASGLWHRRSWMDPNGIRHRHRANCCAVFQGKNIVGDWQNGMLYQFSLSNYTDNGVPIRCLRRAKHSTDDLKRIFYSSMQLQFQPGVGLEGNPTATGDNFLSLTGNAGDYASTPSSNALNITGDIDIIVYAAATNWMPSGFQNLVSKWVAAGNQRSYQFFIVNGSTGLLSLDISLDGGGVNIARANSTVAPTVNNGQGIWLRGTRGSSTGLITFYTSSNISSTPISQIAWTQLGATVTPTSGAIFSGTAPLEIGSMNTGTTSLFAGNIYYAYVYNGIGGTLAASMVANQDVNRAASWTSLSGEVWTINGSASMQGNYLPAVLGSDPQAMLRWSDDGGFTWSNEHWVSIGMVGAYKNRALWRQLGQARDRIFEVAVTDPVYRVLVSAELKTSGAAH